jgi:hypothetical protein
MKAARSFSECPDAAFGLLWEILTLPSAEQRADKKAF